MKQVLIIRTHRVTGTLLKLLEDANKLDFPTFLATDDANGNIPAYLGRKISLTPEKLERLALPLVQNCFWLFGDYALYTCRHELDEFDYYWMIEHDVQINFSKLERFFDLFSDAKEDFIAPELEKIEPGWWTWTETMQPFVGQTWRCFFPVTRLSGRAIDYLYRRRISTFSYISARKEKDGIELPPPNDEAFVSSELCEAGFSYADLIFFNSRLYSRDTFRFRRPIPAKLLVKFGQDERVYHPVIDDDAFISSISRRFRFLQERQDTEKLKNEIDYGEFGGLRTIISEYFGTSEIRQLETDCPILKNIW